MRIDQIEYYLSILAPMLTFLCTTIVFLKKFIKNRKMKRVLEKTEEMTRKIIPYIQEAEKMSHYSGAEKKEYVMMKMRKYALEKGMKLNEEEISDRIEEFITLTKEVNGKDIPINEEEIERKVSEESSNEIRKKIQAIIEEMKKENEV